ncbi:MAG: Rne/Rng family ribonuclease [Bacteroidota bacterium]
MSKEIIINVAGGQSRIAIVEDGELVELYIENPENVRTIGNIHLGRVRRILPGIKAAFVDIGQKQDAFLHFSDLSDNVPALLELSEGTVPDWSTKSLPKAPKQDEDGPAELELETPEEQRAARRRRDLKRTRGKSRRGRGQKNEETSEAAEATTEQQEPAGEKQASDRRDRSDGRGRRGRGRGRRQQAAPPEDSAVPDAAPEILPPDAVAEPPSHDDEAAEPEAEASGTGDAPSAEDRPKRRRGRRGGRGRNRRRNEQPSGEQNQEEPTAEAPTAEAAPADAETQKADPEPTRSRSRRGRSGRSESSEEPKAKGGERDGETSRPSPEASAASGQDTPERKQPKAARAEAKPKAEETSSSRFVIDLTSKPGRVSRVEEEEEEERSSRRRGSRRGGRRRGRGRSGRGSSGENGKSANSRASSRGGSNRNGSSNRSSGQGSSGQGSSGRSGSSSRGGSSNGSEASVRPEKHLKQDQKLIVKITKEPISSKGPRVSTDVSLAGRFLVLIPQADYVAVSKKIESSKERRRLRALARSLLPESFGLIVRTVAENRDAKALNTDLRLLLDKWKKIENQLKQKPKPPKELHEDVNMVSSIIRDLFSDDYDRIVVDDPTVHRNVKNYVQAVAPQMAPLVKLHKSKEHVFRTYKIDRDVRAAFESRVSLPGGGYLFIEHTEAMHVVDVNSGRAGKGLSQEENALRVNLESARAIAKQLRLRDLGGIICVDFIDMRSDSARRKLYDELKKEFRKDRAVTKLLPMSDFGVVQITRQRLRPSITTTTDIDDLPEPLPEPPSQEQQHEPAERAPVAEAETLTASEVVERLEQWLATYRAEVQEQHRKRPILVRVHPFLAAYLQRGVPSAVTRWRFRTRLKLRLDVDDRTDPLSFSVRDEKSGKNLTKKYST